MVDSIKQAHQKYYGQVNDIVKKLQKNGFIPINEKFVFSRGADQPRLMKILWDDAANHQGELIGLLDKAIEKELEQHKEIIDGIMDIPDMKSRNEQSPCQGKTDFIMDAIKQLKAEHKEESEKTKGRSFVSFIVHALSAQKEPMSLTEAAAKANNTEAIQFNEKITDALTESRSTKP